MCPWIELKLDLEFNERIPLPKKLFKYDMYDEEGFEDDGTTARLMEVTLFPKEADFKDV